MTPQGPESAAKLHAVPTEPVPDTAALVKGLRAAFNSERTRPIEWRLGQLDALKRMCEEREAEIAEATAQDLGKPAIETFITEIAVTIAEIDYVRRRLRGWMKPERVPTALPAQPGRSYIQREPLGVVLIMGAWNYPFQLTLGPFIAAVAAGNCAVLKPSEIAPHTSALIARLVPQYLDRDCVKVFEGGIGPTTQLLTEQFDHIFYTGSGNVGRIIMEAAAKHLTPVTLELGGKSPTIIDRDADLDVAARRIVWGKFTNAGQTCVAPDYILAHESIKPALISKLKSCIQSFFGDNPRKSSDYGRIVNERHHRRLTKLLGSGRIVHGGEGSESERYLAPTLLDDVSPDSPIMAEEIFGPILPILSIRSIDEAISFVNARPKPLALYVFTSSGESADRVLERTTSGGAVVNHVIMHLAVPGLPFGGVGPSGMGAYHGRHGFEVFSHRKSVLKKPTVLDPPIAYPPYTEGKKRWIRRLM